MKSLNNLKQHWPLMAFCLAYLISSLVTYKQFAITSDEEYRYSYGKQLLQHFTNPDSQDLTISPKVEPQIYYFYTAVLNYFNPHFYYEQFHLLNMLLALPIFIASYWLMFLAFKKPFLAILAPLSLLITPSFSGQIPGNPIDVPFATAYLCSLLVIYATKDSKITAAKIFILGLSFWLTQSLRPLGFTIYAVYIFFNLVVAYQNGVKPRLADITERLWNLILIFLVANFFMVITWPYLGINYFRNLTDILIMSSKYSLWSNQILFLGQFITPEQRPWYYLPTYIGLTTPIYILVFYFLGFFNQKNLFKNQLQMLLNLPILICFTLYLVLAPVIYNGLRHFLFLIPLIVLSAIVRFNEFLITPIKRSHYVALSVIALNIFLILISMWQLHPFEYAYFNEFTNGIKGASNNFETEYFGASYKESAEWIRDVYAKEQNTKEQTPTILKVYSCNVSYAMDYYSHKKYETTINRKDADLIVCDNETLLGSQYNGEILNVVSRQNTPLNFVIKPY